MESLVSKSGIELLNQFSGKKVLITGHTGFKGSWLSYWLHSVGAVIKGYALAPVASPNLYDSLNLSSNFESVIGDINDFAALNQQIQKFHPDFVFHLAAQPLVRKSYREPLDTFNTNVTGTANLLEATRQLEKPCVCVCITTDKVYENKEWIYPYREGDRLGGYDPYSASKACAELVVSAYSNSFFNISNYNNHNKAIATARAGNVIGGGDWSEDRLIPDIVRAISQSHDICIRNPNAVRPWQHVMEPLLGYMMLALSLQGNVQKYSGAWNFGPQTEDNFSVTNLAEMAVKIWGQGKIVLAENKNALHEAHLLRLDISKAIGELKWVPKLRAAEAIERTIKWYQGFYNGGNVKDLVEADLNYYHSLLK